MRRRKLQIEAWQFFLLYFRGAGDKQFPYNGSLQCALKLFFHVTSNFLCLLLQSNWIPVVLPLGHGAATARKSDRPVFTASAIHTKTTEPRARLVKNLIWGTYLLRDRWCGYLRASSVGSLDNPLQSTLLRFFEKVLQEEKKTLRKCLRQGPEANVEEAVLTPLVQPITAFDRVVWGTDRKLVSRSFENSRQIFFGTCRDSTGTVRTGRISTC